DAIFWGGDPSSNKILAQVKAELSELRPEDKVVVIATSNKEQLIDQATRDRFEPNIYYVHPPQNDTEWNEVVGIHLKTFSTYSHPIRLTKTTTRYDSSTSSGPFQASSHWRTKNTAKSRKR